MIMLTAPFRLRPIVCFCLMALPALARAQTAPSALPTNGTVASGSVTLRQDANTLRVNQASDKAIVNWQTFNIGRDAAVQFVQPGAGSAILNRVASGPSDIAGKLTSNGRVYLVNPNGVLFGASARVDVGSLVVAAGTVSDSSFLSGAPRVASRGAVGNAGTLNTADGGSVVLAGSSVTNRGSINAPHGAITLAAGDAVRINLSDDGLIQAQVTLAAPQALATNSGVLASEGGQIALAASAGAGGAGGLVIDSGIVRAGAVRQHGGTVSLIGGEVQASGSIDVSSSEGAAGSVGIFGDLQAGSVRFDGSIDARGATAGGTVETSAARVRAGPAARVATLASNGDRGRHGTWLIDPQDYTIGNASGDDISGESLSANLNQGNVTIQSVTGARSGAGDIHVNAPVSWGAGTTLTLTAENSILFASGAITDPRNPNGAAQANLTATGNNAGLVMNFKNDYNLGENKLTLSGATPHVTMNGVQFTVINSLAPEALNTTARNNLGGNYVLTSDIDATPTRFQRAGLGWEPLGSLEAPFSGKLHGFGHVISNLGVNDLDSDTAGLFGSVSGTVRDLGLLDPNIVSGGFAGAVAGAVSGNIAQVRHVYAAGGSVSGSVAGGLLGTLVSGELLDSASTAAVSSELSPGGVVGLYSNGTVRNTHYDADTITINGAASGLTIGALRGTQYADWLANGRRLDIARYSDVLPRDPASGAYLLTNAAGMQAMLGFADDPALTFRLGGNIDLASSPGLFLPYLGGTLDGNGHQVSNLKVDAPTQVDVGLVGVNLGTVRNIGATNVDIVAAAFAGGLVGNNQPGARIETSFSTGKLTSKAGSGGLVGINLGDISNTYSRASVGIIVSDEFAQESAGVAGGLVGVNSGTISNSLATGPVVTGGGGLVGDLSGLLIDGVVDIGSGPVTNSFWNIDTTGAANSNGGIGKTTAELQSADIYTGWDFANTWRLVDGSPTLRGFTGIQSPAPPPPGGGGTADGTPVPTQSLALSPASLVLPRVPDASAGGSVALAANLAGGATPQRKELFLQAGDAITRDPSIGTLKNCGDDQLGDCIAKPRTSYKAQVSEDTGGAAPTMHIKRKLALVIGNNDYHSPLSRLEGAGRDASAVAAVLQQQGYQVDHLADADRSSMIASLNRLIRTAEPDDSVLVFYAGHGYIHPGSSVGYWIPTSADVDDPRGWISNIDIARFMANIPARQQLLVSDSCFSGSLTREGVAEEQRTGLNRNAILMRRSVVALSSGGEEVVADSTLDGHSPFTYFLLRQLQEAKGEIPARDMLLSIRDKVTNNAGQVPSYGIIISSGHASGGEYLLNPKTN
jgi:filamentous hemagglutinin family protein